MHNFNLEGININYNGDYSGSIYISNAEKTYRIETNYNILYSHIMSNFQSSITYKPMFQGVKYDVILEFVTICEKQKAINKIEDQDSLSFIKELYFYGK